jgi:[glutamine synthetase] adenylyltransferase / [glutamine synthetase]-adenylyl-L-tyrosine phosphorylase
MSLTAKIESFIKNLPDADGARRFYLSLAEKFPAEEKKLTKNEGLLSDVLTLAAFSPLLAATILQNKGYIAWLKGQRLSTKVRDKEELLESLARFALTNSMLETNVLLARFRRRELLRIYLRDIRNLGTIAEITEEISHLADAILEFALRQARQELDNRYGSPLEIDSKNRSRQAEFCIVALGKLGSNELNYASDIDLLFLYSNEGMTSGQGTRGAVTNREYFIKLAENIGKIVGEKTGEGAAYRVDLRLRPHGRVGALAISMRDAVNYYQTTARSWERQVLIRSRVSAGDGKVFREFSKKVESNVFSKTETVENALQNVRLSKEKINLEKTSDISFNVKLGKGGIREIEFIAQALQLAFAGKDQWLRAPHTLISLSRLADRQIISETELTELFEAYEFLRRLEHRLQMENGLQMHTLPNDADKRDLLSKRMNFADLQMFENDLKSHTENVSRIFSRIFGDGVFEPSAEKIAQISLQNFSTVESGLDTIFSSLNKSNVKSAVKDAALETLKIVSETSSHFAEMIAANPNLIKNLPTLEAEFSDSDYRNTLLFAVTEAKDFKAELAVLRQNWSRFLLEIVTFDIFGKISRQTSKRLQTALAEASLEAALFITKCELERRFETSIERLSFAVLGLGKLGGGGMDYGSDLDVVLIYDNEKPVPVEKLSHAEFYSRAVEIFVTVLSSLTRDGTLYRVDLRLRPDGKNGATSIGKTSFLNYLDVRAAIWEWLAYVKLRGSAGDLVLAKETETEARKIIHENAQKLRTQDSGLRTLMEECRRIRERLETEKSGRKGKEIDIKFGAGGMLDVYFAVRFLQLRDNIPDDADNRSTVFTLKKLHENNSVDREDYRNFSDGYEFLAELDHNLRLTVGRSSKIPLANRIALQIIVKRMSLASVGDLFEQLTFHRLNIRSSFENVFKN